MELHLVPDTNLFFEFKPLDQLPWQELGNDPVVLLLTKPVLDEIDKHKKAAGRTRDRAIDIYGRFRAMLESGAGDSEILASGPRVVLRRMTTVPADPDLAEHLDYDRTDERLIGIVSTLSKQAGGHKVMLFTDDGGPAGMAQDLGVPFKMIPQAWRRPPAETTEAKQLRDLKKVVEIYQNQEPRIAIRCETADNNGAVTVVGKTAVPLTEIEVDGLVEALRLKHPLRHDFTPPENATTTDTWGVTKTVTYSAPADDDIANYRDRLYPQWLDGCRDALRRLHVGRDEDAPPVTLRWAMSNDGSRPAERVRVEFDTDGHLALQRPRPAKDDEDEDSDGKPGAATPGTVRRLPPPPRPPAFGETVTVSPAAKLTPSTPLPPSAFDLASLRGMNHALGNSAGAKSAVERLAIGGALGTPTSHAMRRMQEAISGVSRHDALFRAALNPTMPSILDQMVTPVAMPIRDLSMAQFRPPRAPDPEKFLYASWPVETPVRTGALTCQLWRHQTDDEIFEFNVLFAKPGDARGVVESTVHADNITEPPQAKVIVERKIDAVGMLDVAKAMVEACS
jgi:hypothetical protein